MVILMMAVPWCLVVAEPADSEIERNGTLLSYRFDGEFVWVTETLKVEDTETINGDFAKFTEIRITYQTYLNEPISITSIKYYDGNQYVTEENLELRQKEHGKVEQFINDKWYQLISDSDKLPPSGEDIDIGKWFKKINKAIKDELASCVGEIIFNYVDIKLADFKVDNFEEKITDDISIYRSGALGIPVYFTVGEFIAPAMDMTDSLLMDLDPFVDYLVFTSRMIGEARYICPVGLDTSTTYEILELDSWKYSIWTARGDSADSIIAHLSDSWEHHDAKYDVLGQSHYHFIKSNGDVSNSMVYYGLSNNQAWQPSDGDQWWFD